AINAGWPQDDAQLGVSKRREQAIWGEELVTMLHQHAVHGGEARHDRLRIVRQIDIRACQRGSVVGDFHRDATATESHLVGGRVLPDRDRKWGDLPWGPPPDHSSPTLPTRHWASGGSARTRRGSPNETRPRPPGRPPGAIT